MHWYLVDVVGVSNVIRVPYKMAQCTFDAGGRLIKWYTSVFGEFMFRLPCGAKVHVE